MTREPTPRACEHCHRPLERKRYRSGRIEPLPVFLCRHFCNHTCRAAAAATALRRECETRHCEVCGEPFSRRRHPGGRLESIHHYCSRRFCSPRCKTLAETGSRIEVKECAYCNGPLPRQREETGRLETPVQYERKRVCSEACGWALILAGTDPDLLLIPEGEDFEPMPPEAP